MAGKPAIVVFVGIGFPIYPKKINIFAIDNTPDYGLRDNVGKKRGH